MPIVALLTGLFPQPCFTADKTEAPRGHAASFCNEEIPVSPLGSPPLAFQLRCPRVPTAPLWASFHGA